MEVADLIRDGAGMPRMTRAEPAETEPGIEVVWARHLDEVRAAQRLRYRVFAEEMGARLHTRVPGHDIDLFDDYCEHLLVRDTRSREVIGTYRVLTPAQARRAGGTYTDTEFDLAHLHALRERMIELGRSCVHPAHRNGAVLLTLWTALFGFMKRNNLDTMVGCASVPMEYGAAHGVVGGGHAAASIWHRVRLHHLAEPQYQVSPRLPLPVDELDQDLPIQPPALIKAYLRLGSRVMGPPAWDPDFNSADLPMMMRLSDLPSRYHRHLLGS